MKSPQINTFPSDCVAILLRKASLKLHVNVGSNQPHGGLKLTIVTVTQLVKLTHTSFVQRFIGVLGTTVHIPSVTVAVHIVAHHVPYLSVTIDHSVSHVPLTHGY